VRRGMKQRRLLGSHGGSGLASAVLPVAIGVILALAWNVAVSHQPGAADRPGVPPQLAVTVEQAAAQAWSSTTPFPATGTSRRSAGSGIGSPAAASGHQAGGCRRVRSSRIPRAAEVVPPVAVAGT
jgi:hypothetical protein